MTLSDKGMYIKNTEDNVEPVLGVKPVYMTVTNICALQYVLIEYYLKINVCFHHVGRLTRAMSPWRSILTQVNILCHGNMTPQAKLNFKILEYFSFHYPR